MYTGTYSRRLRHIRLHALTSYLLGINPLGTKCFYFDAATSIPFAWIDWSIVQACDSDSSPFSPKTPFKFRAF